MARYLRPFYVAVLLVVVASLASEVMSWPASGTLLKGPNGLNAKLSRILPAADVCAQMAVSPLDDQQGHVALGLALRHLSNAGIFMMATAHPDDENNGLFVLLNRGQGFRTTLATATRGNGGQNEIGPEIFEALGVLRTGELEALHRFDGAEQYFTRAVDFGYSFSIDETMQKWGRDEIIGDYVRLIRTIRPDVITAQNPDGTGGGLHHQTASLLSREAFKQAGDPTKYPEQIQAGLRAWQPKKFYIAAGRGGGPAAAAQPGAGRSTTTNLAVYDPLLGRTYAEIGTEARSMHKCQGMAQLLALPGGSSASYELIESAIPGQMQKDERALFDGVDTTIAGLAQLSGVRAPRELSSGLSAIASAVQAAQKRFDTENDQQAVEPLLEGLAAVRSLRAKLRDITIDANGRAEIDFRLRQKEREFQQAIVIANSLRVEALVNDGVVVPGQPVRLSLIVANRGAVDVALKQVRLDGFADANSCTLVEGAGGGGRGGPGGPGGGRGRANAPPPAPASVLKKDQIASCDVTLTVPATARVTEPYWHRAGDAGRYTFDEDAPFGLPNRPTPFYAQITFGFVGREDVFHGLPIQYRYEGAALSGEKRSDLLVVPPYSVRVSPEVAVFSSATSTVSPATPTAAPAGRAAGATAPATQPAQAARGVAPAPGAPGRGTAPPPAAARGTTGRGAPAAAPAPAAPAGREIRVTVVNDIKGPSTSVVELELPSGWAAAPSQAAVNFTREDESQTLRFRVSPPARIGQGEYHLKARVTSEGMASTRGFQVVEYPHIRRQHIYRDADVTMKVIDVKTSPNLTIGYIMGAGDEVPAALEQMGAKVELLDRDDLAWGDLARFGTIVTGVRAYEQRQDLIANNSRLLDYVRAGGTLIVQYNRDAFNAAQYGPYPAVVTGDRVTDENAPVRILAPQDPVFNQPNTITETAWRGWIQERGIQFLGERDSRYRDLVELEDPFPNNAGVKRGALVHTRYGQGHWVYVGLGLWRELSVGVDGAYQLFANLVSLGHP